MAWTAPRPPDRGADNLVVDRHGQRATAERTDLDARSMNAWSEGGPHVPGGESELMRETPVS